MPQELSGPKFQLLDQPVGCLNEYQLRDNSAHCFNRNIVATYQPTSTTCTGDMSDDGSLTLATFSSGKKKCRLQFSAGQIIWDNAQPPYAQHTLPIENVINLSCPGEMGLSKEFTIHYAKRKNDSLWRHKSLTLSHPNPDQVSSWVSALQNHLNNLSHRPKRLLLFVNPYGGKRKALRVYEKYAKPLFKIAGVDATVIISQQQNQIRNIVLSHNLDLYDAVACVGGDGTVSELLNGLVLRECRLRSVDHDDPTQVLPRPTIPIGIIPGGSTDTTAYCLHGTTDVITSVLHIIFGDPLGLDLVSVHNDKGLLQIYADVVSYGYLGDIAHYSEQLRWMGTSRYEYVGFRKILANQGYSGELTILSDETDFRGGTKCYENCPECFSRRNQPSEEDKSGKWTSVQGKFFLVSGANISCAGNRNPNGLAPYCHLGDGYVYLIVVRHTSLLNSLRTLHRFTRSTYSLDDLAHVEVYRAKEFRFRADEAPSRWNCDGEVIHHTDIRAKVHCQLLTVYSRGRSNPDDKSKGCCGT